MPARAVGQAVPRKEGWSKVTGRARYIDDLTFPGMLYGVTVRSHVPRGTIREILFEGDLPWHEFTVVTARDIPGANSVALILPDQPYLAETRVNHCEEAILLLAHPDPYLVERARGCVRVVIDPLPAVLTLEESLAQREIIWGDDNVFKNYLVEKGDIDSVWAHAAHIVEGEYRTGAQEQLYIETNGMVAIANPADGVTVWGSLQCPFYVHKALVALFALPEDKVRVIQAETGGGFGGKEEYPSLLAGHAALLAWKSGKAVKMIYDRAEDMVATTKRHPSRTRHRTAVSTDGKLLGIEIDFDLDGGAYATLSSVVLSRGTIHAAGPYSCPNVRICSRVVATNVPPHGAFRGFGAPQSIFALERHMDHVARAIGMSPVEFRKRNFLREGDTTATGQVIREPVDMAGLLDRALAMADSQPDAAPSKNIVRASGFATFMHGAGFTGSGERYLQSSVGIEALADGRVRILVASTEIGQGTNTIFSQIASDALGIPYESVELATPDTSLVPNSGPTVASRTCMVVGKLVESAAIGLRQTLAGVRLDELPFAEACAIYIERHGPLKFFSRYQAPPQIFWDDDTYRGDAYGAFAWAVYVARVAVDLVTCQVQVEDFVALQEIGKVIHPVMAAGQIEGGVAQGIGFALYEKVIWLNGRMANGQMTNYIMPTSMDLPLIRVAFEENPYAYGPGGAKGIGELPMDGPAPAILNAIENAVGRQVNEIPLMPEMLMEALA